MPNRWPISSGNWSNSAIWSGSIIPTASDAVYMNNQVVTLDQNITVSFIDNAAISGVTAGGRIEIYGNFNISASYIRATGTHLSAAPQTAGPGLVSFYGTGSTTITSQINLLAGNEVGPTLFNGSSGTLNVIGNVNAPVNSGASSTAVINGSTGVVNIVGNISSSNNNAQNYGVVNNAGTLNVTGNVTAGSSNGTNPSIANNNVGIVNVTGNVFGCPFGFVGAIQTAIAHNSVNSVNVTGNVQGVQTAGIASSIGNTISVIGQCIASLSSSAVTSTSTTATNVFSGPFINSGSRNAIYCYNVQLYKNTATSYRIGVSGSASTITLLSEDQAPGLPAAANVRSGITYGPTNTLTGSMAVPNPQSVSWGVAVDQTTGTALAKPEDLWNVAITSLTASNSIGQRLAVASTSASMAAIINAFTV
jgi:hypothetical protein